MFISSIFGFSMGLSCGLLLCLPNNYSSNVTDVIADIVVDTIIDSLYYESIDTTVLNYPWGREEIYYFKYKEN